MTATKPKPPIRCTPCRVTFDRQRYQIENDGTVRVVPPEIAFPKGFSATIASYQQVRESDPLPESVAKRIRQEASRLRRNRNARERNQARRDLWMKQTPYGWE